MHLQHWQMALAAVPPSPPLQELSSQDCATHVTKYGKWQKSPSGSEQYRHMLRETFLCLQTSLSIQGTVVYRAPSTHMVCVVPQEHAKLNEVWLLRFWLEKYCRRGDKIEKGEYLW